MSKIKMLVINTTFKVGGGAERFLLNFLSIFPREKYEIDLLLFNYLQDDTKMFDAIPKHINILPCLLQFSTYSPELIETLRNNGQFETAKIKQFVHDRNHDPEYKKIPFNERLILNWETLQTICPMYEGYDYAIAFVNTLPLRILDNRVKAHIKCTFIHIDFEMQSKCDKNMKLSILSEHEHYSNIDHILCVSDKTAQSFKNIFPDLSEKISVLLNVSNADRIKKDSGFYLPKEYDGQGFNILTIARVCAQKNIKLLLLSASILKKRGVNFKWIVLGHVDNGKYALECMKLYDELELNENVYFAGEVTNPFPYYKNCSLFVLTSEFEGRSLAIEEAMILERPIVATNYKTVHDQIIDKVNGRICEMTPESVANVIEELYNDETQRQRLSEANVGYTGDYAKKKYLELFCGLDNNGENA